MIEHLWFWENKRKRKYRTPRVYIMSAMLIVSVLAHCIIAHSIWKQIQEEKEILAGALPTLKKMMTIERDVNLLKRGSTWMFVVPCDKKSKHGLNDPKKPF